MSIVHQELSTIVHQEFPAIISDRSKYTSASGSISSCSHSFYYSPNSSSIWIACAQKHNDNKNNKKHNSKIFPWQHTFPVKPLSPLPIEEKFVVDIGQEKLDTPALHSKLVLHQDNWAPVVSGLWAGDESNLITVKWQIHNVEVSWHVCPLCDSRELGAGCH